MDARLKGLTDAAGNLAPAGFIEMHGQLIYQQAYEEDKRRLPIIPAMAKAITEK